ncbi:efflux RND transporter periplasmic adaptor subunit [Actinoplanes hulinensis]|uniref:Efflux RND transporter periplasmic adaptor subunit n=1 Tax=Actinoplanes hulinensis TaxID=1144547 RepID=A0ABS7B2R5_9ACTN|nr:efflux RND transporter periplasmic adaptor subunit [Actinoplanes hulinensis]MBW6435313.1 efflux RND transporter periplasmic adaptor subunit [Actinoplanes hulinensis]
MGVALAGRRRLIRLGVVVVVLALVAFGVVRALTAGAAREESKAAETVEVDRGEVTTEVATTGTLRPAQTRSLSFAVSGTVETVKVRAGTTVTAGQVLATVDDTDAAEAVDDAQDALDDARAALTKASSTSTSTGCDVAAAYTTASASPSASVSASPSATATTSPTPTRTKTTKPSPTGTKSAAACSSRGGSSGGDSILSAQQRVNAAEVNLEEAEEALDGATITAPIAGKIISVGGKVGSSAKSGSTFVTLADVYDMQISADFPEADADRLAVAQKAVITLADRAGETFDATVVQVDPVGTSDGTLTRFGVVLSFDDAPDELLVGQSANVRVTTGSKDDVLRVPSTAVHDVSGEDGTVLRDGTATQVKLGLRGDRYTEIVSGLTAGEPVARSW